MSEAVNTEAFWVETIVDWLVKHASLRKERIDLKRKFTQEPYNLSAVRVLTMMDELVALHHAQSGAKLVLSQNWRLTHRNDTVGDFIVAFLGLVCPNQAQAAADNGASPSTPVLQSRQGGTHNKRVEALRADPHGDWKPVHLEIIASQYAMKFRKITGTHEVFLHPSVPHCVTIPLKAPIRPPHIRAFVAMIDGMDEAAR
ncbi:hypothetical protein BRAD285_5730 [Bradyrhizobium sp. ORS 285]|uniref:hypothetical protein n=1 Tax=Bradyrhizobium sp. ORS 285 TaxID=115808 RepID=UPI00024073E2|nr:hypothetical protein [Bradyrhizobium sp. ORS 285]CCD90220.1 conserved hypothetical protein [Bradyrhizobium sp. ORS 285]SMX60515.1 hypothetical protein BRAD285_5730 [Bradyrhizobium sp. ORS 285]